MLLTEEWEKCLENIIVNKTYFHEVGEENKKIVEEFYSVEKNYFRYIQIFNSLINRDK